jgi:fatty-acyl-CoA synthase
MPAAATQINGDPVRNHKANMPDYLGKLADLPMRLGALWRCGLFDPIRPLDGVRALWAVRRWGAVTGAVEMAARRDPSMVAIVDEAGSVTFGQLDAGSNALARAWIAGGLGRESVIALLCRDHRWLVYVVLASAKIGARLLMMNTGFSQPQLADVADREQVDALACDQEFGEILGEVRSEIPRYLAYVDDPATTDPNATHIADLIARIDDTPLPVPSAPGGVVLLTSGTTGTPKGAPRQIRSGLSATHFVERIPLRRGDAVFIASPMFHATGYSQLIMTLALGGAVVVRRRFDPEQTVRAMADNRCAGLVAVPTQLRRVLDLGPEVIDGYDTSHLRVIVTAGSPLTPDLSTRALDAFGPVVYNLYGSTEVAVATIATPEELRVAPGTVGRSPRGCHVRLYDRDGNPVTAPDEQGRIFVGSELSFTGYTGGGGKQMIDGLLSSGDVGHFDESGLLFLDGRDDDMIVSGGENVFPAEIESLLVGRPDIADVAVIGVDDPDFGQRLRAFVVPAKGCGELSAHDVREFVRANLARYKVPRDVMFLDDLPRNATGKVLRTKLAELG